MMLALFRDEANLAEALRHLRAARIGPLETYTPAPLRDEALTSPIPVIILAAGLIGATASLALQTYSYTVAYPFPIGGRPQFAWPSFLPTVFENAVLVAIAAGFAAFMLINRMPRLYEPIDEADVTREVSRDGWVVAIRSGDNAVLDHARRILHGVGVERIEEVAG
ncbi:MAG TPA: DUF3341 domain-containing protein [Acetobacteraceae bacterium]|nr:DUF3341 domain-containing protein [Acetobacteraceae bacterium]